MTRNWQYIRPINNTKIVKTYSTHAEEEARHDEVVKLLKQIKKLLKKISEPNN